MKEKAKGTMRIVERKVSAGDREIFDLDEFLSRPLYAHLAPTRDTGRGSRRLVPLGRPGPLDHRRHVLPREPQAGTPLRHRHRGLGPGDGLSQHVGLRGRAEVLAFDPAVARTIFRKYSAPTRTGGTRGSARTSMVRPACLDPVHARDGRPARPILQTPVRRTARSTHPRRKTNQLKEPSHGLGQRDELTALGAAEIAHRRIAAGDLSCRQVVEGRIRRIELVNRHLNALVLPLFRNAPAMRQWQPTPPATRGVLLGPLHGVPFTVKEYFTAEGTPATLGIPGLGRASGGRLIPLSWQGSASPERSFLVRRTVHNSA